MIPKDYLYNTSLSRDYDLRENISIDEESEVGCGGDIGLAGWRGVGIEDNVRGKKRGAQHWGV